MKIKLTKGMFTEIDEADFEYISQWKWGFGANGYAVRTVQIDGKKKTVLMHRVLLSAPKGTDVDHANQDKLDNRRNNLRLATRSQNRANTTSRARPNSELPMGVSYNPSPRTRQPFMARVCRDGKSYFCGNFYTVEEAHEAYLTKKRMLFGEFA